ncbi:precorrin-3B C17-methyltransferase [Pseudomonas aeruginosa]|uniref:precorrin-3B C(17)-methyltransferase n=1 Tax=Pseudomonas aeruginosa TaxID=287 RepID=UPI0006245F47|nr:precorrin-3B C(17)-methyltransferase [Pseudomonas aeruginosa]AKF98514.1 precorrin-3B C17-methyltransferase [Pseudomonas aeruginosa]
MSDAQQVPAIVILGQGALDTARRVQARYPGALVHGLAGRVEADRSYTDFGDTLRELYCADRPIVALCAAGIVIRSLAPLLQRKGAEPPVLALAEDGSAVVPLLGGLAGVNRLAREIGEVLAVAPAITTSGELRFGTCVLNPPVGYVLADLEQGKRFVADLLGGQPVRVEGAADWLDAARLPRDPEAALAIHVTPSARAPRAEELLIHPRCVLAALEPADAAADAVRQALVDAGLAAAPLAMDRIGQRRGRLTVIGLGPGCAELMVPAARRALDEAEDILGYQTYVDMAGPFRAGQVLHGSDNREELQRARHAFELAATGRAVVLVSSGDPGVFAMAAAVLEALHGAGEPAWDAVELRIFPGVSAALATAARAGAPLGHDFCLLSLSDNLKPWEVIERRLDLAGAADLAMAFYNPISRARPWQLGRALEIVARHRSPQTLVVLGRDIGRPGERLLRTTLGELRAEQVDMRTLVIIGSSTTCSFPRADGEAWVYTPRWYPSE